MNSNGSEFMWRGELEVFVSEVDIELLPEEQLSRF